MKGRWCDDEDRTLLELQRMHGNKWKQISCAMGGRAPNDVKNRFHILRRRAASASASARVSQSAFAARIDSDSGSDSDSDTRSPSQRVKRRRVDAGATVPTGVIEARCGPWRPIVAVPQHSIDIEALLPPPPRCGTKFNTPRASRVCLTHPVKLCAAGSERVELSRPQRLSVPYDVFHALGVSFRAWRPPSALSSSPRWLLPPLTLCRATADGGVSHVSHVSHVSECDHAPVGLLCHQCFCLFPHVRPRAARRFFLSSDVLP